MSTEIQQLIKALELGSYDGAPSTLTQGSALQFEDLSPTLEVLTFKDEHIKLQKSVTKKAAKGQLVQFNRQLDYGTFGGTAQYEGGIGEDTTASYQRITVPMSYYSTYARASIAANMAQAFDGIKAEDRVENDAEMKLVADIEFDLFRGQDDFSNGGVFDGSPAAIAEVPNLIGLFAQVRIADTQSSAQDLMFAEYGGSRPVVLPINGNLRQTHLEDASVISSMNHGSADKVILDPIALSNYNKIAFAKERIVLAGAAHESTGANLRKQWTSAGMAELEASRFLSGKTAPARPRAGSPAAPAAVAAATASTAIIPAGTYDYYVSAVNERGESVATKVAAVVVAAGEKVTLTITNNGAKYYNVYRAEQGKMMGLIGKVKASTAVSTLFTDLGNKIAGSSTGALVQSDTMGIHELASLTKLKLAVTDLSMPSAVFRFLSLAVYQPRKNVLLDNIKGIV